MKICTQVRFLNGGQRIESLIRYTCSNPILDESQRLCEDCTAQMQFAMGQVEMTPEMMDTLKQLQELALIEAKKNKKVVPFTPMDIPAADWTYRPDKTTWIAGDIKGGYIGKTLIAGDGDKAKYAKITFSRDTIA